MIYLLRVMCGRVTSDVKRVRSWILGLLLLQQGERTRGEEEFKKAEQLDPQLKPPGELK